MKNSINIEYVLMVPQCGDCILISGWSMSWRVNEISTWKLIYILDEHMYLLMHYVVWCTYNGVYLIFEICANIRKIITSHTLEWWYPTLSSISEKVEMQIFIQYGFLDSWEHFIIETTIRAFEPQNTNKTLWALGLLKVRHKGETIMSSSIWYPKL